ncbi:hypothetical protein PS2_013783 [Malus domestica]
MLSNRFDMKDLGEAYYVLGIEILRSRMKRMFGLSQKNYIGRVLKRSNMENCSSGDVPIVKGDKFSLSQSPMTITDHGIQAMKDKPYAYLVGRVMYAQVCTRNDLAFAPSLLGIFQSNPSIAYWNIGKNVLRYLKKTQAYVLGFHRVENLEVICYSDVDLLGCIDDRMSTN